MVDDHGVIVFVTQKKMAIITIHQSHVCVSFKNFKKKKKKKWNPKNSLPPPPLNKFDLPCVETWVEKWTH